MRLSDSFAGKKNFENGHTKPKLLRFEVESGDCGQKNQGTIEKSRYYRA
jgi:hypothetical protein